MGEAVDGYHGNFFDRKWQGSHIDFSDKHLKTQN